VKKIKLEVEKKCVFLSAGRRCSLLILLIRDHYKKYTTRHIFKISTTGNGKCNRKHEAGEADFFSIASSELEYLSVVILTPLNFWKSLTDIMKSTK
jgi:hypothetical protein